MLEYAYRTEAKMLNRVRVRIPDTPGVLARITQRLAATPVPAASAVAVTPMNFGDA